MSPDQGVPHSPQIDYTMQHDGYNNCGYYPETPTLLSPPITIPIPPKVCQMPMTPTQSPVDVYHQPAVFQQPGTPLIYTTPDVPDIYMHAAPQVPIYTPPIEYVPTSPFCMVASTPPTTGWYTHGINAQGFIFPPPMNTQTAPRVQNM